MSNPSSSFSPDDRLAARKPPAGELPSRMGRRQRSLPGLWLP